MQDQEAEPGTNSSSPYDGFDTGYLNKNHNILGSLTRVYGSTFTTQTKVVWNRLLGDQPLNGDSQPTLYMNPTDGGSAAGLPHRVPRLSAVQPRQRDSVRRAAAAAAVLSGSDLDQGQARPPFRRFVTCTSSDDRTFGAYANAVEALNTTSRRAAVARQLRARPAAPLPDRDQPEGYPRRHLRDAGRAARASPARTRTTSSRSMRTTTGASAIGSR